MLESYTSKLHDEVDVALVLKICAHSDYVFMFDDLHDRDLIPQLIDHPQVADLGFRDHFDGIGVSSDIVYDFVNFAKGAF